ncbi:MAG TPA: FtsX-like permease family protein [Steroidobacteraceae bacterium]|nr:FtsX-like permease family protein [Steroidobacteraceae bacterium]
MNAPPQGGRALLLARVLLLSQLREQPARLAVTVLAIALGVALGAAVYLVNSAALNEFGLAAKRLVGEADIVIRGPPEGFDERLYAELARDAAVRAASPVLELQVALPASRDTLTVLGLDPFRAATLQPALIGDVERRALDLFAPDAIILSSEAAQELGLTRGGTLRVIVGDAPRSLRVIDVLPGATYSQALGIMDIASAQWTLEKLGRLNRIDLSLMPGIDVASYRAALNRRLPAGTVAVAPQVERDRARTVTRAYRVNLDMLALVALWTGAFLVFSTQSLSALRRRRAFGLLRALGARRAEIELALVGEGAALGLAGSIIGIALGLLCAAGLLRLLSGDLGNEQLYAAGAALHASATSLLAFLAIGTAVASAGAWLPARTAARQAPAQALKGGDPQHPGTASGGWMAGVLLLALGGALARLPAVAGLPLFGYAAIAALLFGAVLLVPTLTMWILRVAPRTDRAVPDAALAQLKDNIALSTLSLASIIVSFSLMVAMAIMVYSFRVSFEHWLGKLLPADLQLREPLGNDTAYWSLEDQRAVAALPGVSRVEFRRTRRLLLDPSRPAITLIARASTPAQVTEELPLVGGLGATARGDAPPAWISEALADLYGYRLGDLIELPLGGQRRPFRIAGIWRDYVRATGAVVITRAAYLQASGDDHANEGSVWLVPGASAAAVESALRTILAHAPAGAGPGDAAAAAGSFEILTSTALRERSMRIFDRAFAITYALEVVAVLIGLLGVSFAASSTALARRAEFGMLRHLGMRRGQVISMLASEGMLMSLFGVVYGLILGIVLSLVLVFVVNRQSFNWSIDFAVPLRPLALLSVTLIAAAALTAVWSGRIATGPDAVRAVREDW